VSQGASTLALTMPVTGGTGSTATAAISGPAGVAAMSGTNQSFIDSSFTRAYDLTAGLQGGTLNYFGSSLGMISLLVMSGNMFDYRNPP